MSDGVDWEMEHGIGYGDFPDSWDRDDYLETKIEYVSLIIALTPSKFLSDDNILIRHKLLNSNYKISGKDFEVYHDKYNQYDKYALEIFYKSFSIGYVLKRNSPYSTVKEIDDFAFNNGKMDTLEVEYDGENLILSKERNDTKSHEEEALKPVDDDFYEDENEYEYEEIKQLTPFEEGVEKMMADSDYSKIYDLVMNNSSISAKNKEKRITEAYKSLMAINDDNFIYSTINFFGGDSNKIKEEQKEELFHSLRKSWQLW